jgi:hypothetical protein
MGSVEGETCVETLDPRGELLVPYGNRVFVIDSEPGTYHLSYQVQDTPSPPPVLPEVCLANQEAFTKWRPGGVVEQLASMRKGLDSYFVQETGILVKNMVQYSYPRDHYEYTDEMLPFRRLVQGRLGSLASRLIPTKLSRKQDCLGMHALLCATLRASGVPALLDVGFRLGAGDAPHTWLWYWDREKSGWTLTDLNDSDMQVVGEPVSPRLSVSLGTSHDFSNITGIADSSAAFLQYAMSKRKLQGEKIMHEARFTSW